MNTSLGSIIESSHVVFAEKVIPGLFLPINDDEVLTHSNEDEDFLDFDGEVILSNVQTPENTVHNAQVPNEDLDISEVDSPNKVSKPNKMTDDDLDEIVVEELKLRKSERITIPIDRYKPAINHVLHILQTKLKFKEAVQDIRFFDSMRKEIKLLFDIGCIGIVDLPTGRIPIGSTWAHKLKFDSEGEYIRAKSRICPWGFMQKPGIDYDENEVSAPTLPIEHAMLFTSITVDRKMFEALLDVDTAFQLPKNKHDVYMRAPEGIKLPPGKVIKLINSMNGTKQGAFNWNYEADILLKSLNFKATNSDSCFYYRYNNNNLTICALYVDDFRIAADDKDELDQIVAHFKRSYSIKDQPTNWWLGLKVEHDRTLGILKISQEQYILKVLEKFKMSDCKPVSTPAEPNSKLVKTAVDDDKDYDAMSFPYREAVGALLWIARTCRPDILYAVNQVGSHCNNPNMSHITAVKRILRYLKGSTKVGITFRRSNNSKLVLEAMSDADWAGEPQENTRPMCSTSGIVLYLKGIGPIQWVSSLQSTIAGSTAEAEYKSLGHTGKLVLGMRQVLEEIGFQQPGASVIFEDNNACIVMANSRYTSSKMRHMKINHHLIREYIQRGEIMLKYCPSEEMIADMFTKAVTVTLFTTFRNILLNGLY